MYTGKCVDEIKTGWSKQGQNIFSNGDGSIIISSEVDDTDYTKSPPMMVFDTKNRKKIFEMKQKGRLDLRPEVAVFTEDGKYFYCVDSVSFFIY